MRFFSYIWLFAFALILVSSCGLGDDPKAEITIVDVNNRPIPGAKVEIFSRPTNNIREDIKFTDEGGKTYHEFMFEGTFDVKAQIDEFTIYNNLKGTGEIILTRDETYHTTITLTEPEVVEEK